MREMRIGILDSEDRYVEKLAGALKRHSGWRAIGFTSEERLGRYMERGELSLLLATDRRVLEHRAESERLCRVWLTEDGQEGQEGGTTGAGRGETYVAGGGDGRGDAILPGNEKGRKQDGTGRQNAGLDRNGRMDPACRMEKDGIFEVCRFQSVSQIIRCLEEIAARSGLSGRKSIPMLAVYSPVGRCGKTALALRLAERGRGLYLGMEDYGSFPEEDELLADRFYYYVKEKRGDRVTELLARCGGRIATGTSPFDMKLIGAAELGWLREQAEQLGVFHQIVVDMGTGVVEEPELFTLFDGLIVPYLAGEPGRAKEGRLKRLLDKTGAWLDEGQVRFVNMEQGAERVAERLLGEYLGDI